VECQYTLLGLLRHFEYVLAKDAGYVKTKSEIQKTLPREAMKDVASMSLYIFTRQAIDPAGTKPSPFELAMVTQDFCIHFKEFQDSVGKPESVEALSSEALVHTMVRAQLFSFISKMLETLDPEHREIYQNVFRLCGYIIETCLMNYKPPYNVRILKDVNGN
jgi:hypothetical protein